jgi:predicted acylesterase/phospholipase RssA
MATIETINNAHGASIRDGLRSIAGTSAGSIVASMIACNVSAQDAEEFLNKRSLVDLVSRESLHHDVQKIPNVSFGSGLYEGTFFMESINDQYVQSIKSFLQDSLSFDLLSNSQNLYDRINGLSNLELEEKVTFLELVEEIKKYEPTNPQSTTPLINFDHLRILNKLDPSKFKDLTITGYDVTNKEVVYFNAATHPEMPIAVAVRISSSIPPMFKSVHYYGKVFVDGGAGSKIPSERFLSSHESLIKKMPSALKDSTLGNSLVQKLQESSESHESLLARNPEIENIYQRMLIIGFNHDDQLTDIPGHEKVTLFGRSVSILSPAIGLYMQNPNIYSAVISDKIKVWDAGSNAFRLPSGTLNGVNVFVSKSYIQAVQLQAESASLEYFFNRNQQATYKTYPTLQSAIKNLSHREIEEIIRFYDPEKIDLLTIEKVKAELLKIRYRSEDQEEENVLRNALKRFYATIRSAAEHHFSQLAEMKEDK